MKRSNPQTSSFTISPEKLELLDTSISSGLLDSLSVNHIELKLNVFDSDPDNHDKPVLVLLHGNSSSMRVFAEQINHFSQSHRVIAIDMLGHGQSSKPGMMTNITSELREAICAAFYHPQAMMTAVAQCLQSRNIKQADIIGWSLGGHIAYGIAAQHPDLVHSIISIGSPPVMFSSKGFQQGFSPWFVETAIPSWVQSPKQFSLDESRVTAGNVGFTDKTDIEIFAEDAARTDAMMRKYLFINLEKHNDTRYQSTPLDGESFVKTTHIPLYICVGDHDFGMKIDSFTAVTSSLKHPLSQVCIIPGGTHALFKNDAQNFNQQIENWLGSLEQTCAPAHLFPRLTK